MSSSPYAPQPEVERDTAKAERLTQEAAGVAERDPEKAERLLREALAADLYHGPAHNNLGVLFLERGQLYEAAAEFEWAGKLMPGHPDPRLNLGLALERAGRADAALDAYATALEVYPGHIATLQAMTRLRVRADRPDDRMPRYLEEVAMRGETEEWREWAREMLARAPE